MSSILVVGADHLGKMPEQLNHIGFEEILHIDGRKGNMVRKNIPDHVEAVLVLTDYVNHNLAKVIRQKAKAKSVPVYFAKRSWSCILHKISEDFCASNELIKNYG